MVPSGPGAALPDLAAAASGRGGLHFVPSRLPDDTERDPMDRKEMQNTRLYLLAFLLVLILAAYLFVLYDAQVIHHDDYAAQAIRSIVRTEKGIKLCYKVKAT